MNRSLGLQGFADQMCNVVDQLEKDKYPFGSPLFNFQQDLIAAVKKYRKDKTAKVTEGNG